MGSPWTKGSVFYPLPLKCTNLCKNRKNCLDLRLLRVKAKGYFVNQRLIMNSLYGS